MTKVAEKEPIEEEVEDQLDRPEGKFWRALQKAETFCRANSLVKPASGPIKSGLAPTPRTAALSIARLISARPSREALESAPQLLPVLRPLPVPPGAGSRTRTKLKRVYDADEVDTATLKLRRKIMEAIEESTLSQENKARFKRTIWSRVQ